MKNFLQKKYLATKTFTQKSEYKQNEGKRARNKEKTNKHERNKQKTGKRAKKKPKQGRKTLVFEKGVQKTSTKNEYKKRAQASPPGILKSVPGKKTMRETSRGARENARNSEKSKKNNKKGRKGGQNRIYFVFFLAEKKCKSVKKIYNYI